MKTKVLLLAFAAMLPFVAAPASAAEESWADRIKVKGDLRLRHEQIDEEGEASRDRLRYRARLRFTGEVSDNVKVVIGMATGGNNPVSRNVSFDNGFSTKDFGVELAYVDWQISDSLNFYGGKMSNPLFAAGGVPLVYDGDLTPEGLALAYSAGGFFGTAASFVVEERSSASDSMLLALQGGYTFELGENASLTAGAGYFGYSDTVGNEPFYNGNARGNTVDVDGNYVYEYKNTEVFAQFDTKVRDWPLRIYAHTVKNNEVSDADTGLAFGAKLGSAKSDGKAEFSWTYMDIEADAVIGTFNDSDFAGGNTDAKGHMIKAKYAVNKKIILGGTLFMNEADASQAGRHDYDRLQLDIEFKFN